MKTLRVALALVMTMAMGVGSASAQRPGNRPTTRPAVGGGGGGMGRTIMNVRLEQVKRIVGELGLSDEQKSKVDDIIKDSEKEMKSKADDMDKENTDMRDRMEQTRMLVDDLRVKIEGALTKEQKETFTTKMDEVMQQRGAGGPGGMMQQRMQDAIAKGKLTDEQKAKVKEIIEDMQGKMRSAMQDAQGDREKMRDSIMQVQREMVEKLKDVLTPEQQQIFRDEVRGGGGGPGDSTTRPAQRARGGPAARPGPKPSEEMAPDMAGDKAKSKDADKHGDDKKDSDKGKDKSSMATPPDGNSGVKVGEAAPNLELRRLDGRNVQLSSYKGRVVVLVFGSYSTPTFRQQAAALEQLKKENELRAEFTIVYTREAHPTGSREVERNKDDGISVEPARDEADRKAQAKKAKDSLHLTVPIAIDSMDDALASAFGAFPNGAVLIGRDGKVFAKQRWFQPYTMGLAIEQAAAVRVASTQGIR